MSDWTWEYLTGADDVVGGLTQAQVGEVESLAARIADAVGVRRIGAPFDEREAVSDLMTCAEGLVLLWYLEDYRENVVLVARVQHLGTG